MLGHLFFEHFLQDGLHAFPDPGLHVALDVLIEPLVRGQVCLLNSTHNLPDTVVLSVVLAIAGLLLIHRLIVPLIHLDSNSEATSATYQAITLVYGVTVAFAILLVWEQLDT